MTHAEKDELIEGLQAEIEELKSAVEESSSSDSGESKPPLEASAQIKRLCGLIRRRFGMSGADHVEMLRLGNSVANLTE